MLLVKVSEQLTVDVLCTCLCCAFFARSWLCEFTICLICCKACSATLYLMVVVCRLTGYILAMPTQKWGLDSRKLAEIVLERVVFFMGLLNEVHSDNTLALSSQSLDT